MEYDFEDWMRRVDVCIRRLANVRRDDLPDYDFRDAFDASVTPIEVAEDMLRREGWLEP